MAKKVKMLPKVGDIITVNGRKVYVIRVLEIAGKPRFEIVNRSNGFQGVIGLNEIQW
jgi:hypothetical protein